MAASAARSFRFYSSTVRLRLGLRSGLTTIAQAQANSNALPELFVDEITSVNNRYIKHCVKLRTNLAYRRETGRMILAGRTVIAEQLGHENCAAEVRSLQLSCRLL